MDFLVGSAVQEIGANQLTKYSLDNDDDDDDDVAESVDYEELDRSGLTEEHIYTELQFKTHSGCTSLLTVMHTSVISTLINVFI